MLFFPFFLIVELYVNSNKILTLILENNAIDGSNIYAAIKEGLLLFR